MPCFCFGVAKSCRGTGRYRQQIHLQFDEHNHFKGEPVGKAPPPKDRPGWPSLALPEPPGLLHSPFFPGVNVTSLDQPGTPPLASTQMQIDPGVQEFLLVDLSRHFLMHDAFWTLPKQFLGNKARAADTTLPGCPPVS